MGTLVRTRRAYTEELERRAEQLERERDAQARLAVAEERARIARELHDIVAHGVGVMVVQASAGRSVLPSDSAAADAALTRIESTGRTSLVEMRRLLSVLRSDGDGASRQPQPGLDALPELLKQVDEAGIDVSVSESGVARPLAPGTEVSAYRIIQEALTNVLKHAETSRARLALTWSGDMLRLEVSDGGRGSAVEREGHGLKGMRERLLMLGGGLEIINKP